MPMQFGNATINMAKFSKLAKQFGEEEATRVLREQYVTNPNEKAFLERQNDMGFDALARGGRVKFGGVMDDPFTSPSMTGLYDAAQMGRANYLDAQDTNLYAANHQDRRRGKM
jgi:hypothetical protein